MDELPWPKERHDAPNDTMLVWCGKEDDSQLTVTNNCIQFIEKGGYYVRVPAPTLSAHPPNDDNETEGGAHKGWQQPLRIYLLAFVRNRNNSQLLPSDHLHTTY